MDFSAAYTPETYEKKWWDFWMSEDLFASQPDPDKTSYTVLLPPPNVTDRLHMGHGLNATTQDILVRWKRMSGFAACWLPGTDHAGIATQMMVENALQKQGKTRQEVGREAFFQLCCDWKDKNGHIIIEQLKKLGASCDWKREAYTMNEGLSQAVRRIFVDLYESGLVYRGERLVNWDPVLQTAISDDEVYNEDVDGNMYHIAYQVRGAEVENTQVVVATTRPETMFGDAAIAVHPEDDRYQDLIGKEAQIPFTDRWIPIIADEYVKSEFGTGCLKITPAHDPNDFEVGKRHQLPMIQIMNPDATLNELCPEFVRGLDRFVARDAVIQRLKANKQWIKTASTRHSVPHSDRSKSIIEPRLSMQWYVKMQTLAEPAIRAAQEERVRFHPESWKKTYFHWMENIQDWCISRQLWWGHRIPIWYCEDCAGVTTGMDDPTVCGSCGSQKIVQDPDVLDTWFSSWLWPLSPFGWPEETEDLRYYFPTDVLVTGADIIFLWVARMVMVSLYTKKETPFRDVYFNSIICDKDGRKFSKTLGNGIDPLQVIEQYGADAVRFTIIQLAPMGGRVKLAVEDFDHGNRFLNKIWNAARFLHTKLGEEALVSLPFDALPLPSKWLLHELRETTARMEESLTTFHFQEAASALYQFIWQTFCDWGLESAKEKLDAPIRDPLVASTLYFAFEGALRLAAPFIPFLSEELWSRQPIHPQWKRERSLVISAFPKANLLPDFSVEAAQWSEVQALVSGIRSLKSQMQLEKKEGLSVFVRCSAEFQQRVEGHLSLVCLLARVSHIRFVQKIEEVGACLAAVSKGWSVYVPLPDATLIPQEKARISTEIQRISKILGGIEKKLQNEAFVAKAPEDVLRQARDQFENMSQQLTSLQESFSSLV